MVDGDDVMWPVEMRHRLAGIGIVDLAPAQHDDSSARAGVGSPLHLGHEHIDPDVFKSLIKRLSARVLMVHRHVVGGVEFALRRHRVHAAVLASEEAQPVDRVNRDLVARLRIPIPERGFDDALLIAAVPLGETTENDLVVSWPLTSTSRQQVEQLLGPPHASVGPDLIDDGVAFGVEFQHARTLAECVSRG